MAQVHVGRLLQKVMAGAPLLRYAPWSLEAAVLALLWSVSARLTPERASQAGQKLLRTLGPRLRKSYHARRNLSLAFPDQTPAQIEALVQSMWGNFGAVLAEYPHLKAIVEQRLEIHLGETVQFLRQQRKPAVFVTAHLANWELAAAAVVKAGFPLTAVYAPFPNPLLNRLLQRRRQALGCDFVPKQDSIRQLVRQLTQGKSVGFLVDQRVDSGEPVPFFGREAYTASSPARLALRFRCELIPVRVERLADARFRATFYEPIRPVDGAANEPDKALQMTRQLNDLFEVWIREQPGQWLCTKRRWPKTPAPSDGKLQDSR